MKIGKRLLGQRKKMEIVFNYITPNEFSRPQKKRQCMLALVMHWTANATMSAQAIRDFFDAKKTGAGGYGSAHYVVGQKGEIIACVPENEIAYHCGSSAIDPASQRVYTDEARARFGAYAADSAHTSPNFCTIGVELCPVNLAGDFSEATIKAAAELAATILHRYRLDERAITTHHDVVGWKDCPRSWTAHPELLESFRADVKHELEALEAKLRG